MVEVVIASVVVTFMIVGVLNALGAIFRTYAVTDEQAQAYTLAKEMLYEIMHTPYSDPNDNAVFGTESDESSTVRNTFDDIDDYQGWSASPPEYDDGTPYSALSNWTRSVEVAWVDVLDPNAVSDSESGLKRVQVTVTSPRGVTYSLSSLHAESGRLEWRPPDDISIVSAIDLRIVIDENIPAVTLSTPVHNYVEGW